MPTAMPESAEFKRLARNVMMSLIATVALPLIPVIWDLQVHACVNNLQAARDRLDALRERLVEPLTIVGAPMALAEDLLMRRTVSELLDELHAEQHWCAQADLNGLHHEFDMWFSSRATVEPFMRLEGVIDAAVYRSRAAAERAHWAVAGGCFMAMISAVLGWLSLRRMAQIHQAKTVNRVSPFAPLKALAAVSAVPVLPVPAVTIPISRLPLPPTLTPPVFRPIAAPPEKSPSPAQGLPAVAHELGTRLHGRVLVIEDNPINQRVTQRQLMELGLGVEVVGTAEIGLVRLANEAFDAVLMDLQLPGIDGLTATRRWRAQEAAEGRRRLPIIAITANAMGTDREACYSAGMDGYQAKPARLDDLYRVLVRWVGTVPLNEMPVDGDVSQQPILKVTPSSPLPHNPMLALLLVSAADAALTDPHLWSKLRSETAKTDPRLLEELMAELCQQAEPVLAELEEAMRTANHESLRAAAHRLKGSAGMLGLPRLSACAKCLEFAAKEHNDEVATRALAGLRDAYAKTLDDSDVNALR